jgi:4-hydroxythreonine-4-phosphate dehydrogenase
MMLSSGTHRVALATTHIPLHAVPQQITQYLLRETLDILYDALQNQFNLSDPRIHVCGLNPHAGENGHLGDEEIKIISPVIQAYQSEHKKILGPFAADTLFQFDKNPCDAILAMYHDQGLTPLKTLYFGNVVNTTLGLPYVRTSVDHGTALNLVGTGKASLGSFIAAFQQAENLK